MAPTPTELRLRDPQSFVNEDFPDNLLNGNNNTDRKLVGVDGNWYDVTDFIDKHPGGPIIEQFIGQDATTVFHAYDHKNVLKYRKPVGHYKMPERHPADKEFDELVTFFKKKGFYVTDWMFYFQKTMVIVGLISAVFYCVMAFDQWYMHYLGAFILAFFWQQNGFIMHEFMHSQVFHDRKKDEVGGLVYGTFCFGISAHWWKDEHIIHHAMTNVVDVANRFVDPQMWESCWAQNEKLFPLFQTALQYCLIKIQHFTFIPVVVFFGRYEIVTDSMRKERRPEEWVAWAGHCMWLGYLLSQLPTWREVMIFYFIAASVQGIFHFQLILSHYCQMFMRTDEFHKSSWYAFNSLSNMNIDTYRWLDWYYGGLNFHIEHHMFPTMARKNLRHAAPYVKAICDKHGIPYESRSFFGAMMKTLQSLKVAGSHFKLDPR